MGMSLLVHKLTLQDVSWFTDADWEVGGISIPSIITCSTIEDWHQSTLEPSPIVISEPLEW